MYLNFYCFFLFLREWDSFSAKKFLHQTINQTMMFYFVYTWADTSSFFSGLVLIVLWDSGNVVYKQTEIIV